MEDFVNLHSHTYHSHMDAIIRIPDLFKKVVELNQPGIAITDHGVLAGIHEGYKEYKKYKEKGQLVKFIPGSEIYFCEDIGDPKAKRRHLILLAQNEEGYRNLLQINAAGFKNSVSVMGREFPRVDLNIIKKHSAGLFINSACGGSPFAAAIFEKNYTKARDFAARFQDLFGDKFHVELQPHEMQRGDFNQSYLNDQLKNLAEELKIDMIATCDSHYLTAKHEKYHDMILAIGAKKSLEDPTRHRYATYPPCLICAGTGVYPVDSNKECYECNGKKYSAIKSCPEFYLKGRDALVSHFAKKFDSEVAHALVNNTVKIANACEYPDYMEVKGARLPSFPWKDESDAPEFKEWLDSKPALSDIKDDAAFLRFRVKKGFDKYTASFTKEKKQQYWDRVKKELDILESRSFSSYMLIVADYIQWAKNNGVTVGSGRGCLVGNTPVLKYDGGFTQLKDIRVGDRVFTHTGDVQTVTDTMVYDVSNEDLLSIKTDFSFESIELTKDHQVYAVKRKISDRYARYADKGFSSLNKIRKFDSEIESPQWVQAQDLNVGDLIFMPFPKRQVREFQDIDLSKYCNAYDEKFVYITKNLSNELSKRTINRETGLSRGYLSSVKNKAHTKYRKDEQDRILTKYLEQYGHTVNSWINLKNIEIKRIPRYIKVDSEFCYFIGKWIGDGWFRKTSETNMIGIAFNSDDVDEIDRTSNYLASIGFESTPIRHNTKNLIQLCSYGKIQAQLLKDLFKDYESTSGSKYIGEFKYLNDHLLKELLLGLLSADGHIETGSSRINFDTTSRRMAEEIKECLLYLHIPSSISTREPYTHGIYECSKAYKVRAKGLCVEKSKADNIFVDNGYLCRITDISTTRASHVYDITVENDHSYVTSNYAVHNSVGGSLVAYLLGIHMADSIKFGLLFERFQNKEKKSLPDIDVDFSPAGREKVIQYCRDKYGEDKVAFISNIMRLTPKLVIKDVARSLILGGDKSTAFQMANDVTASIPDLILDGDKRIKVDTMAKAMDVSEKLRKFVADYPVILEYANELIGIPRGFATHAAGIVISDIPLQEFVPLRRDRDGSVSIQYDKDACEENGLVKMDFLGLETLDIIDETLQIAEGVGISLTKPDKLEDGDAKTYKLIQLGHTAGMFQLNGSMTPLCKAMLPKSIPDIAAISAIGRPTVKPKERMEFINRRHGKTPIKYLHPCLEPVFKHTYGIPVYEEDLLKLAQMVAGWDLSEADGLRKITKLKEKGAYLVAELEGKFVNDAMAHSKLSREDAQNIWTKIILPFAGYAFNLAHAILYSMISYQTAYYKAHAPGPFICANLNSQTRGNKVEREELINSFKKEAKLFKVAIISCDINLSKQYYAMKDKNTIVTGLGAIKGVGDRALNAIIAGQPYASFQDFLHRVPGNVVNKSTISALALAGAFDSLGLSRKYIYDNFMEIRKELQAYAKKNGKEVLLEIEEEVEIENKSDFDVELSDDYSGDMEKSAKVRETVIEKKIKKSYSLTPEQLAAFQPKSIDLAQEEYSLREKLEGEKATLGEYVSGDMRALYPGFFVEGRYAQPFSQLKGMVDNINFPTEGIITSIREIPIKKEGRNKGKLLGKLGLENLKGETVDITVWADQFEKLKKILKVGLPIRGMFKVNDFGGSKSLVLINLEHYYKNQVNNEMQ